MNLMELLVASLSALLQSSLRSILVQRFPYLPTEFDSTTTPADYYDFIVVGAGCGGSVVASRLSETSASVLLLEAGSAALPETAVAALSTAGIFQSTTTWDYHTKPLQNALLGYSNHSSKFSFGKVMGGTSTINGLIYSRGNKMDFDNWARMGNPGWDYDSVLPYFKKSEKYNDISVPVDEKYHGSTGLVKVERKKIANKLTEQFLEAGRQMGFRVVDPNGAEQIGFTPSFMTLGDGRKGSASESFLAPAVNRSNLLIRTQATVRKIIFNGKKRAVGVLYSIDGKKRLVFARKEVILSAGPVNSPHILMLSGVGPRQHLEEMRIPVVADVEGVGQNLQDHPAVPLLFTAKETAVPKLSEILTVEKFKDFLTSQTGPFAESQFGDGYAFFNLADHDQPSWTDVMIALTAHSPAVLPADFWAQSNGIKREIAEDLTGELRNKTSFLLLSFLARPKSRGSITLRSANPSDVPVVDSNVFSHPDDVELMLKGVRKAFEIISMPALKDTIDVQPPSKLLSPCQQHGRFTDAYWECYVRHTVAVGSHLSSSVKMAPVSDPLGAVSSRLRVRGVTGLRVVDVSVMPQVVAGNNMAATYMIAERGADMIKEDWGYPTERLQ